MIESNKSENEVEEEVLSYWKKNKIFEKLRTKNKGKKRWSFIDGPITANNPMGVHHAWGRTYKDLFHRFKAMQGYEMRYQNGFDCQGLWVEREEEKDLGLKNKKDIEKFGILNFIKACKKRVEKFSEIQTNQSIRLGCWMDWKNSYYTMSDNNNLHNWHLLKTYFEKKWLYKGKDAVPWCWRCGTASSKHDIATEGYKEVTHKALFMQFPLKESPKEYFLIFTTTPWTVPANVAIALNPNLDYVKIESNGVYYWLAESRLSEFVEKYRIIKKKKGKELKDIEYVMPYAYFESQKNSPHKVILWNLASGEEGTGIVHIAPGCGTEDFKLGKKEKLPAISPLDEFGVFKEGFKDFSFKKYSEVNKAVLNDLEQRKFVYKISDIKHRYPHCWRCGEELVFRMVDEWYVKANEIKQNLISENRKIKWYPEYGKKRQEEWFKNMGDWLISRKRYWGLPLPIWECECGEIEVIGSLDELKRKAINKKKVDTLPEIHRPWIDEIKIKCKKCGRLVERIKDVGDAWLDAGIVMFSTLNYLQGKEYWKKWYPADLISENMPGQYRGWFNAIMWAGVALSGKAPFNAMFGYETLKDEKGEEMHKSKGNVIWFDDAVEKVGADPIRLLYCLQDPSQELRFGFNVLKEQKNNLNIFYNISKLIVKPTGKKNSYSVEDKWIISRFNSLIRKVTKELESLHPNLATKSLKEFWLNDLSRGYIQFVRDRIAENDETVQEILNDVYINLSKLCAPVIPFITENIWQSLKNKSLVKEESVHLCDWPEFDSEKIDEKLEEKFSKIFETIESGLAERDQAKIGLRWPLSKAVIYCSETFDDELTKVLAKQLNVKKIEFRKKENLEVEIDTTLTLELEAEGFARELARKIQDERKKVGLKKGQLIELEIYVQSNLKNILEKHSKFLQERTNSKKLRFLEIQKNKNAVLFTIKNKQFGIKFH